jgi:hypothetical protein
MHDCTQNLATWLRHNFYGLHGGKMLYSTEQRIFVVISVLPDLYATSGATL